MPDHKWTQDDAIQTPECTMSLWRDVTARIEVVRAELDALRQHPVTRGEVRDTLCKAFAVVFRAEGEAEVCLAAAERAVMVEKGEGTDA